MKLLGRTNGKKVIASISHYDYIALGEGEEYMMADGGQPHTNHSAFYTRGWGDVIWFEAAQNFAELYSDYQFNKPRKYGVWNVEDVRILPENEWPDVNSIEEKAENYCWGTNGPHGKEKTHYVLLKDCSASHLKAILANVSRISEETREVIEYLISQHESRKTKN